MKLRELSMMRIFAILCTVLLAGCAGTPAPATQRIDVPLPVPCVKVEDVPPAPAYEFDKLPPTPDDGAKVLALARDWPRGRKYEGLLVAIVKGCLQ